MFFKKSHWWLKKKKTVLCTKKKSLPGNLNLNYVIESCETTKYVNFIIGENSLINDYAVKVS